MASSSEGLFIHAKDLLVGPKAHHLRVAASREPSHLPNEVLVRPAAKVLVDARHFWDSFLNFDVYI